MRRSMARDQIRAGVSKTVGMANTGHSDARVFDRYDMTAIQAKALLATEAFRASAESDTPYGQSKRKCVIRFQN